MTAEDRPTSRADRHPTGLILATSVAALAALIGHHGFVWSPRVLGWFNACHAVLTLSFVAQYGWLWWRARDRRLLFRWFRLEYLLVVALVVSMMVLPLLPDGAVWRLVVFFKLASQAELVWDVLQLYLLGNVSVQLLRLLQRIVARGVRPELILAGSFAGMIAIGTLLLLLPRAGAKADAPIRLADALFTATSAVCVTGLVVRDTGTEFTTFGQMIILALFQVGGLGIITFVAFLSVISVRSLPVPQMIAFRNVMGSPSMSDLRKRVAGIVLITLLIEGVGVACLYAMAPGGMEPHVRLKWSLFHTVSAFCNAGFALQSASLEGVRAHAPLNLVVMALIFLGGLGFLVILDAIKVLQTALRNLASRLDRARVEPPLHRVNRWSVQSRLSLRVTFWLILAGLAGFWLLEDGHALKGCSAGEQFLISSFQSVTARTAGFNTIPIGELQQSTLVFLMLLMIIGACPVSAGGGIKTVTFGILLLAVRSMILQKSRLEVFGRTLPPQALIAALSVFVLYTMTAAVGVFALAITDPDVPVLDMAFEMVSALSTVGLSTGITADLSIPGQLILCLAMFVGRIGPVSLVLVVFRARKHVESEFPTEEVVVS